MSSLMLRVHIFKYWVGSQIVAGFTIKSISLPRPAHDVCVKATRSIPLVGFPFGSCLARINSISMSAETGLVLAPPGVSIIFLKSWFKIVICDST